MHGRRTGTLPGTMMKRWIVPAFLALLVLAGGWGTVRAEWPDPTPAADSSTQTQAALNLAWILLCGFLVFFMQAGFALVETGLTRAKNVAHTMAMNFLVYAIGIVGFWAVGFALQMGGVGAMSTFGGDATLSSEF